MTRLTTFLLCREFDRAKEADSLDEIIAREMKAHGLSRDSAIARILSDDGTMGVLQSLERYEDCASLLALAKLNK